MPVVPDCSSLLCLAFAGEDSAYGATVIEEIISQGGIAPSILWYELRNALAVNERRGRIAAADSNLFLLLIAELPLDMQPLGNDLAALELSRRHELTVYDAAYLELAHREGATLATLDRSIIRAAEALALPVLRRRAA